MAGYLSGHISLFAVQSMKSIDNWMQTLNANLNGAAVNAFKQSEIYYGGGTTSEFRTPSATSNGIQIAEQSLYTGHTVVDWTQGQVVNSTQEAHMAIQGEGFFGVVDPRNFVANNGFDVAAGGLTTATYGAPANQKVYLTRDGEFHFSILPNISATDPVLVDKNGFAVLADAVPTITDNIYHFIFKSTFDSAADPTFANGFAKERPSVIVPSYDGVSGAAPTTFTSKDELIYSKLGSTYYEAPSANSFKTIVNGTNNVIDKRGSASNPGDSFLINSALEASNTRVDGNITELALLGKIYNGFVQVVKVYNSELDDVLNFVR